MGKADHALQFTDNRPESIANNALQDSANNSPYILQLKALQETGNNSSLTEKGIYQLYPDEDDIERIPEDTQELAFDLANNHPASDPEFFQTNADKLAGNWSIEWTLDYDGVVGAGAAVYYAIHAHFNNGNNQPPTHLHFKKCGIDNMQILFDLPLPMFAILPQ